MKLIKMFVCCLLCLGFCLPFCAQASAYSYDSAYAETPLDDSYARRANIQLAALALDGLELSYGERFSFNDVVGERSKEAGYLSALNGRGARVVGGGVAQVATTLCLAAQGFDWLEIEEYTVYGDRFTGSYVSDGSLAVVTDYDDDYDFAFTSLYPGTVVLEAWLQDDKLCCALTGYENASLVSSAGVGLTPLPEDDNQLANITLAAAQIDGSVLEYGQTFSFNDTVGPRTESAGYVAATNGRGARVIGGGVAQAASTLYLAVKNLDSVTIEPIRTYGDRFTGGYVDDPADAIVTDYNAGIDFVFTYYGAGSLYIFFYDDDGWLHCDLYEYYE